jgi:hypothetical protein
MALTQVAANGGKVGSIGASWPPAFDASNARIKGICPTVIRDKKALYLDAFAPARNARRAGPEATRTTFRAFVRRELVEKIRGEKQDFAIEARVPSDNFMPGFDLVYFGRNYFVRQPPVEVRRAEIESLENIRRKVPRVDREVAMARLTAEGYQITMPKNGDVHNERDMETLLNLYQEAYQLYTFPINKTTIQVMLGNGNRVVIARDADRQIASVLIAEECEIRLDNGRVAMMYELSDFATFLSHSKKGLMTALQIEAVRLIRSLPGGQQAIIYAEDRAPWKWVNKSSQQAGMVFTGTLLYHCTMMARRSVEYEGTYESLNVWYAP